MVDSPQTSNEFLRLKESFSPSPSVCIIYCGGRSSTELDSRELSARIDLTRPRTVICNLPLPYYSCSICLQAQQNLRLGVYEARGQSCVRRSLTLVAWRCSGISLPGCAKARLSRTSQWRAAACDRIVLVPQHELQAGETHVVCF